MKEKFVVFEGLGGSGKSTQIELASKYLRKNRISHIVTREPGGSSEAELVRELIFTLGRKNLLKPDYQVALYSAARLLWVNQIVKPSLKNKKSILCDRTYFTMAAFQGYGQGVDLKEIEDITAVVMENTKPDAVILINVRATSAYQRLKLRAHHQGDPFDEKDLPFFQRVGRGYRRMANQNWGGVKWYTVNGEQEVNLVEKDVQNCLQEIFSL